MGLLYYGSMGTPVWTALNSGTTDIINGVWGPSGNNVFAVGVNGMILYYNMNGWFPVSSGTTQTLLGIWGTMRIDVFAVGDQGTIVHYNGSSWTPMNSGTSNIMNGVWGASGNDVFAVGENGTILHYDGNAWSPMNSGTINALWGIWGSSGSGVFAVGDQGTIVHYNGSSWTSMNSGTTNQLLSVWGRSESDVFAVGDQGTIVHYNGSVWTPMTSGTTNRLLSVSGSSGSDVFAVGDRGTVLRYKKYSPGGKIAIYRQGLWYLDIDHSETWGGCGADGCWGIFGGLNIDIPIMGDWTGDGVGKIGIYRQGMWYLDLNGNGKWDGCETDSCLGPFGGLEIDVPAVGDWNGNGLDKIGIYRQGMWYLDLNGNGGWDGCEVDGCKGPFGGLSIDIPVVGDWSGDAVSRIGIYRAGNWYLDKNGNGGWDGCEVDDCKGPLGGLSIDKPVIRSSLGSSTVLAPNVMGMDQASAQNAIFTAGLVLGNVSYISSFGVPAGRVFYQSIISGTSVVRGSAMSIFVSSGPPGI
jgi:hypothetical protein